MRYIARAIEETFGSPLVHGNGFFRVYLRGYRGIWGLYKVEGFRVLGLGSGVKVSGLEVRVVGLGPGILRGFKGRA